MSDIVLMTVPEALRGTISELPGDKSVSHRAVMISALSDSTVTICRFLFSEDCLHTMAMFQKMGVRISADRQAQAITVFGKGLHGLQQPKGLLDVGNSGTCMRLMTGLLAAQPFESRITGDASIQQRPMGRVTKAINEMGAHIDGQPAGDEVVPPLHIRGNPQLSGITYRLPVASAQVKSAILFAGLTLPITITLTEPQPTRDHTERMLAAFGADIRREGLTVTLVGGKPLRYEGLLDVPGDISSAAFFIGLGLLHPDAKLRIRHVGLNPTRRAILDVLLRMGADLQIHPDQHTASGEPMGEVIVRSSQLHSTEIHRDEIPNLIDEIPILAMTGLWADHGLEVRHAKELRVKESDRIMMIGKIIRAMGGTFLEYEDGFRVEKLPPSEADQLRHIPFEVDSGGDHRIAMAALIGAAAAGRRVTAHNTDCIATSFPNFVDIIKSLGVTMA